MKNLLRILIAVAILLVVFIYFDNPVQENELITGTRNTGQVLPRNDEEMVETETIFSRPKEGISTLIGQKTGLVTELLGSPNRVEPTVFGFEWWVYNSSYSSYQLIGVRDGVVTQAFVFGDQVDVTPYEIGQSIEDIYRFTIVQSEITISIETNTYTFTLNEDDVNRRVLVQFDNLFAMLYIDVQDQQLEAVRFSDEKTLLLQKPYDILYNGKMVEEERPTSSLQATVDRANEQQIFEISNLFRVRHGFEPLKSDVILQQVAKSHSEEMAKNNVVLNDSIETTNFSDKLKEFSIDFTQAGGNTAAFYFDAGEAVTGWLNSKDHRETLLGKEYTHTGVGVYGNYFTQNLIEAPVRQEMDEPE